MPLKDYELHKERMRERMNRISCSGRDIFPMPPVANPYRRRRARRDLRFFCETYAKPKFWKPFGRHHLKFIERLQRLIIKGGQQSIAMPRGSGKTAIIIVAAAWAIIFGYSKMLVIIAKNKTEATKIQNGIKTILRKYGPYKDLHDDFPEVCYPLRKLGPTAALTKGQTYLGEPTEVIWNADYIRLPIIPGSLASGATVCVCGIEGAIRGNFAEGPNGEMLRPDLVIIDDPQDDEIARNPERVKNLEQIINGTIKMLSEDGKHLSMIMTCTVIQPDDVADRYLNPNIYPKWQGLRYKLLEQMPKNMELWEEYRKLWRNDEKAATAFYRKNRKAMDEGAVSSWPESYDRRYEISAIQYAMNLWSDDEAAFYAEKQNEPILGVLDGILVAPKVIRSRLNGQNRGTVPIEAQRLTAFIDVHNDILYWLIIAWADDFTGYVIDYGIYPDQNFERTYFKKSDKDLLNLKKRFKGCRTDAAILAGLNELITQLLEREFEIEEEGEDYTNTVRIERLLIDSGYKPLVVEQAIIATASKVIARPSRGAGIGASKKPMSEYKKKPGTKVEDRWMEYRPSGYSLRRVVFDANYWKGQVHDSLNQGVGDRGGLSLWGHDPERHQLLAEHANAETVQAVKAGEREVHEWKARPGVDNHFFDCLVGCFAAASTIGITAKELEKPKKKRRSI